MRAYHEEGRAISSVEELITISTAHSSLPSNIVKMFLEDASLATEDVLEEAAENAGPSGAPFFIFGRKDVAKRKIVFSGVQSLETITTAIQNLSL